jgi:hypothetical protein
MRPLPRGIHSSVNGLPGSFDACVARRALPALAARERAQRRRPAGEARAEIGARLQV